jgi:Protein of unknown function (DUF1479)
MEINATDMAREVKETKVLLRARLPNFRDVFAEVASAVEAEADQVAARFAGGESVVPSIAYADIAAGRVPLETRAAVRHHGCAVVRGVFPVEQATAWNSELLAYVASNDYVEKAKAKVGLDSYFSRLKSGRPQIYGIYWSQPQVQARQAASMTTTRAWLNGLWEWMGPNGPYFVPDRDCTYADRIRQREPGDNTLGLSPHVDGGTIERWIDPGYRHVYRHIFSGDWRQHDPWSGHGRTETHEIPSPAVCQMFRTYQGWTALTPQGPGDGTLRLVPVINAMTYMLLRALQDDTADDDLCGAEAGRALLASEKWHAPLLKALIPIPSVQPGDTVWWHPDVIHAVENEHRGTGYSSVIYIGSAPDCAKNRQYLPKQRDAFLQGRSAPDFAAEDYEVTFQDRATESDLSDLGRRQMGFDPWP